jgi:hypothetical protein
MDTHMALVNTAALVAAGLMQDPSAAATAAAAGAAAAADPQKTAAIAAADAAGLIDWDPTTGLPTGLLRCAADMEGDMSSNGSLAEAAIAAAAASMHG